MGETCLTALALLHTHYAMLIDLRLDKVINLFHVMHPQRILCSDIFNESEEC